MIRPFLITLAGVALFAPPAAAQDPRIFASINVGYQAQNQDLRQTAEFPLFDEIGNWQAEHAIEGGAFFEVGAGVRVTRNVSVGVSYSARPAHTRDVPVTASVPDPRFFDAFRSASATATGLEHREQAVHLQALWHVPVTVDFDVTLFGGPTFFTVKDTLIESVTPQETGDFSTVNLLLDTSSQSNSTIGFHAGVDTSYMFLRNAGVGAMLRYSRGSVDLLNPAASGGEMTIDAGGLEIGAGLRFRF